MSLHDARLFHSKANCSFCQCYLISSNLLLSLDTALLLLFLLFSLLFFGMTGITGFLPLSGDLSRAEIGLSTVSILLFKLSKLALFQSNVFVNLAACSFTISYQLSFSSGFRLYVRIALMSLPRSRSFLLAAYSFYCLLIASFKMSFSLGTLRVSRFLIITCMITFLSFWLRMLARQASSPSMKPPLGSSILSFTCTKSMVSSMAGAEINQVTTSRRFLKSYGSRITSSVKRVLSIVYI